MCDARMVRSEGKVVAFLFDFGSSSQQPFDKLRVTALVGGTLRE